MARYNYGVPSDEKDDDSEIEYPITLMAGAKSRSQLSRLAAQLEINPRKKKSEDDLQVKT